MKWLVTSLQRQFRNYSCHKSPKDRAAYAAYKEFILSTCTLEMPPPYIKSSRKSKVVLARYTEIKFKFH